MLYTYRHNIENNLIVQNNKENDMYRRRLLCLFLLPITTTYAMNNISNEIIIYHIGSRLDRSTKNIFKWTNKKHSQLILTQSFLNKEYELACQTNNVDLMIELRKKGALYMHEEMYNLFTDNKKSLVKQLWFNHTHGLETFCIESAFTQGITLNNKLFITFLLKKIRPSCNLITSFINLSEQRGHISITETLNCYNTRIKVPLGRFYNEAIANGIPRHLALMPLPLLHIM